MKVVALTLLMAALAQARVSYHLKCDRDEIGIRWPSYHSNSEYYVCQGANGRQMSIQCNPGEVFTFVLQQCTSPSLFIPPPPIDMLPTSGKPAIVEQPGVMIQYPQTGQSNNNNYGNMQPPIFGMDGHPVDLPHMPVVMPQEPMGEPQINHLTPPHAPQVEIVDSPPTPPPTPGIVKPPAPNKKPVPNKKPSPPVPSAAKKPAPPQAAPKKPAPKPAPKKPAPPSRT